MPEIESQGCTNEVRDRGRRVDPRSQWPRGLLLAGVLAAAPFACDTELAVRRTGNAGAREREDRGSALAYEACMTTAFGCGWEGGA